MSNLWIKALFGKGLKRVANCKVVGIGTRLGGDDQVGLELVAEAQRTIKMNELAFVFWEDADAATIAAELMDTELPVLFADCADMKLKPGQFRVFDEETTRMNMGFDSASTHGLSLGEGIQIARQLGFKQRIRIFAVQPFDISPSPNLTGEMKRRLPEIQKAFCAICREMGER